MTKFLLFITALLLITGITGLLVPVNNSLTYFSKSLIVVGEDVGIIIMLINGSFISTRLFTTAIFLVALVVLGAALKILHSVGANQMLTYPFGGLAILYFVHFIRKKQKKLLDILKVIMVLNFLAQPQLLLSHFVSEHVTDTLMITSHILFIVTFLLFLYQRYKNISPQ